MLSTPLYPRHIKNTDHSLSPTTDYTHDTKGAYDFNDDTAPSSLRPAVEFNETYSTFVFTQRAVSVISQFSSASTNKMFLYLPYQNVHWPLEAPQEYVDEFMKLPGILDSRAHVCAMAKVMDDGIGNVTQALKSAGILQDTLIIFSSDSTRACTSLTNTLPSLRLVLLAFTDGGPTHGNEGTSSNNFPLRVSRLVTCRLTAQPPSLTATTLAM